MFRVELVTVLIGLLGSEIEVWNVSQIKAT